MTQKRSPQRTRAWSGSACSIPLEEPDSLQAPSFSYGVPDSILSAIQNVLTALEGCYSVGAARYLAKDTACATA
jgi:hypothetical protein